MDSKGRVIPLWSQSSVPCHRPQPHKGRVLLQRSRCPFLPFFATPSSVVVEWTVSAALGRLHFRCITWGITEDSDSLPPNMFKRGRDLWSSSSLWNQSKGTENASVCVTAAKMGILKVTRFVFSVFKTNRLFGILMLGAQVERWKEMGWEVAQKPQGWGSHTGHAACRLLLPSTRGEAAKSRAGR